VSILGFGGFHLVETSLAQAATLLNTYLDLGGNYVETAADYGNGASEERIGRALENRRGDFYLATKTTARDADGCRASIEASLRRLRTGHLVPWHFVHPSIPVKSVPHVGEELP